MASSQLDFDRERTSLVLVDIQPDFMPGGALAAEDGDGIVEPVQRLLDAGIFAHYSATQDWHPAGHISFASSHKGREPMSTIELYGHEQVLWPDHCVQGSKGAELHAGIDWRPIDVIIRKGTDPAVDSYSGFRNNWGPDGKRSPTGLAGYLKGRGIREVMLCGLARDVCVKWTAEDAVEAGFRTWFIWDLTRPVDSATDEQTRRDLDHLGVEIIQSADLLD